jgi:hypothetical protein
VDTLALRPSFPADVDHASASYEFPAGVATVEWRREGDRIVLDVTVPAGVECKTDEIPAGVELKLTRA